MWLRRSLRNNQFVVVGQELDAPKPQAAAAANSGNNSGRRQSVVTQCFLRQEAIFVLQCDPVVVGAAAATTTINSEAGIKEDVV